MKTFLSIFILFLFHAANGQNYKITTTDFISYKTTSINIGEYFITYKDKREKEHILKRNDVVTIYKDDQKIYDRNFLNDIIHPKNKDGFNCNITKIEDDFVLYKLDETDLVNSYSKDELSRIFYAGNTEYFENEKTVGENSIVMPRGKQSTEDHIYVAGDHLNRGGRQLNWSYFTLIITYNAAVLMALNENDVNSIYAVSFAGSLTSLILFISGNNNIKNAGKEMMRVE